MINLRNITFYFVGLCCLLIGFWVADNTSVLWYVFAALFIIMGIAFRKDIDTSDANDH